MRFDLGRLLGVDAPPSMSMGGWGRWHRDLKQKKPVAYFFAFTLRGHAKAFYGATLGRFFGLVRSFRNRFIDRTHCLTSETLERGQWHDLDTRILHCLMDELVRFVEIDLAHRWQISEGVDSHRSADHGLRYLDWAATLMVPKWHEETGQEVDSETPTDQATGAIETKAIYLWWSKTRPARPAPDEAVGLDAFCREMDQKYPPPADASDRIPRHRTWAAHYDNKKTLSDAEEEVYARLIRQSLDLEHRYFVEDEEMLIRLIKTRATLWT
jgi:hypothetical protein